ncbi:MAG: TlpA family protein disulfide reductase [Chloroflexi bacterium]|nr:TlpA family protein disulfide reductase [Chloroflexota bacterium]
MRAALVLPNVLATLLGALAILALLALVGQGAAGGPGGGAAAPAFRLATLDGGTVELDALRGRPALLYFFATWCPSCQLDLPQLDAAQREHAERGLAVMLIDLGESPGHVRAVVEGWGLERLPVALDDGAVALRYGVRTLPTTVFVGSDGTVRGAHAGPLAAAALEAGLARVLADPGR